MLAFQLRQVSVEVMSSAVMMAVVLNRVSAVMDDQIVEIIQTNIIVVSIFFYKQQYINREHG